jgi:hypothetical protein
LKFGGRVLKWKEVVILGAIFFLDGKERAKPNERRTLKKAKVQLAQRFLFDRDV